MNIRNRELHHDDPRMRIAERGRTMDIDLTAAE